MQKCEYRLVVEGRLHVIAGVAELGDARDLKSCGPLAYAGSTPAPGTNLIGRATRPFTLQ